MIHFINVVWGEKFTDAYLAAALPNSMSPGNLGAFVDDIDCLYRLYTTPSDASKIRESAVFQLLNQLLNVEIIEFVGLDSGDQYEQLVRCHSDALLRASVDDASVVFLAPDALWSDGSFARLRELIAAGVPVALTPGPRVTKDSFLPEFIQNYWDAGSQTAPITSRELVDLAFKHLHASTKSLFWDPCVAVRLWN